jgi:hypothetical protein
MLLVPKGDGDPQGGGQGSRAAQTLAPKLAAAISAYGAARVQIESGVVIRARCRSGAAILHGAVTRDPNPAKARKSADLLAAGPGHGYRWLTVRA